MSRYDDMEKSSLLNSLTKVDGNIINRMKDAYPDIPDDYIEFLQFFGYGDCAGKLMLYSGLVDPEDVYGQSLGSAIMLFADDYQGYCVGFRLDGWTVVEVDPTTNTEINLFNSFEEYVRQFLTDM